MKLKRYNYLLREFNKDLIVEAKRKGQCAYCGSRNFLEFHHKDPSEKKESVGKMWYDGKTRDEIIEEIKKCILLCHNCHAELHKKQGILTEK